MKRVRVESGFELHDMSRKGYWSRLRRNKTYSEWRLIYVCKLLVTMFKMDGDAGSQTSVLQ